jgi:hypothetical protein
MNQFQCDYPTRLKNWYNLRENLKDKDLQTICVETDKFWQYCPMINHYLHPIDMATWPTPWELLHENNYCQYARALGMVYTLLLLGIKDIDLVDAKDHNSIDVVLVLVDHAKYILNYWPDMVLNNTLRDFAIAKYHNISPIVSKIGTT